VEETLFPNDGRGETLSDLKVSKRICLIKYKFPSFDLETLGFQLGDATGLLKSGALTQKETTFFLYLHLFHILRN